MRNKKAEISLTGMIVGLVMVAMVITTFTIFIAQGETTYGLAGDDSLSKYNKTGGIIGEMDSIRNATDFTQQTSTLDVIGGYFSSGFTALKVAGKSLDLFEDTLSDSRTDLLWMKTYNFDVFIFALIFMLIFVGVIIAILVKMRI